MPDARIQRLVARRDKIDDAIDALLDDRAERASFESWTVDRIQLERLETQRAYVNYQILRRIGSLNSLDVNFGSYTPKKGKQPTS